MWKVGSGAHWLPPLPGDPGDPADPLDPVDPGKNSETSIFDNPSGDFGKYFGKRLPKMLPKLKMSLSRRNTYLLRRNYFGIRTKTFFLRRPQYLATLPSFSATHPEVNLIFLNWRAGISYILVPGRSQAAKYKKFALPSNWGFGEKTKSSEKGRRGSPRRPISSRKTSILCVFMNPLCVYISKIWPIVRPVSYYVDFVNYSV